MVIKKPTIAIVIPTYRLDYLAEWGRVWKHEFDRPDLIVLPVWDRQPNPDIDFIRDWPLAGNTTWLFKETIEEYWGRDAWIASMWNGAVRSFGIWYAAKVLGVEIIIGLDDDCFPCGSFLQFHLGRLREFVSDGPWVQTCDIYTRGFPYQVRGSMPVVLNHGMWVGYPDVDAPTRLVLPELKFGLEDGEKIPSRIFPQHSYFPFCAMNYAVKTEAAVTLYQGLQGRDYPYTRFDDIWAGILFKKIADHLGYAASSGRPLVQHQRASNIWSYYAQESAGLVANEQFWRVVDSCQLRGDTWAGCYRELAQWVEVMGGL